MKIAIVGAGIIGVTTVRTELAHDGHEVTVLEQRSAAAEEASFANAGLLSPYLTTPCTIAGKPSPAAQRPWHTHTGIRLARGLGCTNWPGCGAGAGHHAPVYPGEPRPIQAVNARKRLLRATSWTLKQARADCCFSAPPGNARSTSRCWTGCARRVQQCKTWTQMQPAVEPISPEAPLHGAVLLPPCRVRQLPAIRANAAPGAVQGPGCNLFSMPK